MMLGVTSLMDCTTAIFDGRTNTKTIQLQEPLAQSSRPGSHRSSVVIGLSSQTLRESILIDRVGRLQFPQELLNWLPFHRHAEILITEDHID